MHHHTTLTAKLVHRKVRSSRVNGAGNVWINVDGSCTTPNNATLPHGTQTLPVRYACNGINQ